MKFIPIPFLKRLTAAIMIIWAAGAAMSGSPVVYKDGTTGLFQIEVPNFWNVRTGGARDLTDPETGETRTVSRVMGLSPVAGEGVWVGFVSPRNVSTLDQAASYLRDIGPSLVKDTVIGKRVTRRIGGLPARTVAGHGKRDGKLVEFTAVMIDLPQGRVAIGVVVFEAGSDPKAVNEINDMLLSFKAVR